MASALAVPTAYQILFEFVRIRSVTGTLDYLRPRFSRLLLGTAALSLVFLFLAVATRRLWLAALAEGAVLFAAAAANYFKLQYRGEPLLPRDLLTLGEAAEITGSLHLHLTRELVLFALAIAVFCAVLRFFTLPRAASRRRGGVRLACSLLFLPLAWLYTVGVIGSPAVDSALGLGVQVAGQATTAYQNTSVTNFFYLLDRLNPQAPAAYSESTMRGLLEEIDALPAQQGRDADVVVVLLETYFQFPDDAPVSFSEPLTENYDRLAAQGVTGTMLSDVYGGGTANMEFAAETGFCYADLPLGSIPFAEFVYDGFPCYAQYLRSRGYATFSIHAYYDYFYSRNLAYPKMGIATSLWDTSFVDPAKPNGFISDADSAKKIAETYAAQASASPEQPIYLQCVTMQNHCDYAAGGYTGSDPVAVTAPGLSEDDRGCLETMVSNLRDTDEAIGWLCDYFSTVDRDVVVVFYGDHQSDCGSGVFANYIYGNLTGEEKDLAMHSTPFLIWSNYETAGETVDGWVSPWQLVPLATERFGVAHPRYYDFLNAMRGTVAGRSGSYVLDGGGQPAQTPTAQQQVWLDKLALIQYDAIFGRHYITDALFGSGAA